MVKVIGRSTGAGWVDFSQGDGRGVGTMTYNATSGNDGLVQFMGLPEYATVSEYVNVDFNVDVAPVKISGSEAYSFLGLITQFNLSQLQYSNGGPAQAPTIVLAGPHTALAAVNSNLVYLNPGPQAFLTQTPQVAPNGPITVEFNQAINPNTVRVVFYNEDGVTPAAATPMATVNTNLLSITPNQALVAGARYNILIHADAAASPNLSNTTNEFNNVVPFFVQQASGVTPAVNVNSVSKATNGGLVQVTFTLNEPIGLGSANTSAISCVAFYEGVNLDNGDPADYSGEWSASGPLQCYSQGNPPAGMDITAIFPIEQTQPGLNTGFASKFTINVNNLPAVGTNSAACKPGGPPPGACLGPQSGNKIHLIFSKLPVGQTVRRTNGQPVIEDPTKLVITIP
jgi:hypothetical protein